MRSVSYRLEDFDSKKKIIIPIGFVGENEFTIVNINCHCVLKDHPNAIVTSVVIPPKGDPYPGTLARDGDIVTWLLTASDLIYDGYGEIQFTFTDGEKIGKTWGVRTKVETSAAGDGEIPTPIQNWIDKANEKLAGVESAIEAANGAADEIDNMTVSATGSAYGSDPTATVTEVDEHKHIAFTIPAGQPGADGHTPVKGTDYWTEQDKQGIVSDVVTELIDDTTPAQGKVFSSAKVDEELTDVKTAIQGKYTKPSGGIPATDMTEEVQNTLSAVGKSEERDGIVQTGDTATRNITKDQYVIWKGDLYTASGNIASGETLSLSNLDPVSDGGFNALRDEIEQKHSIKAYKKYVQQEQSTGAVWIVLDEIVDIENGDEIEILIYQSDKVTYGTSWSNTVSWNAATIQNKNNTSISLQDDKYMNSDKPAMKKIKKMDGYVMYQTFSNNELTGFGIDFPANLDSFKRMVVDPVSSQIKAGCTVEITVRKTI